jgi:hypothetical protein
VEGGIVVAAFYETVAILGKILSAMDLAARCDLGAIRRSRLDGALVPINP